MEYAAAVASSAGGGGGIAAAVAGIFASSGEMWSLDRR